MDEKIVKITVDYREDRSGIIEIFEQEYGVKVIRDNLKAGDYLIGNEVVVERKTTLDFAQSIIDGRLFRQVLLMKQNFDRCLFVIEGNNLYETAVEIHQNAVKGALVSLAVGVGKCRFFLQKIFKIQLYCLS